jgi:MurNAc alpha-1-phosphate uridylyltransferase
MKAMILAAGRGERMRPLTDAAPKPLLKIAGKPLIQHHVEALARGGVDEIVINLAWRGAQISEFLGNGASYGVKITYSDEGEEALETGGGVHRALTLLGGQPFWLVNGDIFCDYPYRARSLEPGILSHLVLVANPDHHRDGDFSLDGDRVLPQGGDKLTFSGISVLHPDLFADATPGKFPLAPLLINAMRTGAVSGEKYSGLWTDVGTPERLEALERKLLQVR